MDAKPVEPYDPLRRAADRVHIGPPPSWVTHRAYSDEFRLKVRGQLTHLLMETQLHAELHQAYTRIALRLETIQAVEHQSQWRLEFDPQTQSVTLHSIKVRRGGVETERASLEKIKFLQREAGLEGMIIDGSVTLLLLLEDVRPGDILEWSFTTETHPQLMPEHCCWLFALPPGTQVGKHHFSVRFTEKRALKWKSSSPELEPVITPENGEIHWAWSGEQTGSPEPEVCMPAGSMDYLWINISDCPNWQTVTRATADAWKNTGEGELFNKLLDEIKAASPDLRARINRAIELVQDSFRYLSVDIELGGQIPAPTETTVQRRYGDCKSLSFLLVRLLQGLGVAARPIWVHAGLRKSISALLPSPNAFNHAVVEFQYENEARWIDATIKNQGGGALERKVMDFGLGLPVDPTATELIPVPRASLPRGLYELKETFLVDTTGQASQVAFVVTATGLYADYLRAQFEHEGPAALAKKWLQDCANRFSKATRVGELQYRDDRDRNEFLFSEVFAIEGFLKQDEDPNICRLEIFSESTAGTLLMPSINPRRNPFALRFPHHAVHTVELEFPGLDVTNLPIFQTGNEFFKFSRRTKSLRNFFKATFSLEMMSDSIPIARLDRHRKDVEEVWRAASLHIRLPIGYSRMRTSRDFGALPRPNRTVSSGGPAVVRNLPSKAPVAPVPEASKAPEPLKTAIAKTESKVEQLVFIDPIEASRKQPHGTEVSRRSHRRGVNRKCKIGLWLLLVGALGFFLSLILSKAPGLESFAGLLLIGAVMMEIAAVLCAVAGLRECARHPQRYRGRTMGLATLSVGAVLLCICLIPLFVGIKGMMMAGAQKRRAMAEQPETLKVAAANFWFHAPDFPWRQVDARPFARGPVAISFLRPGPITFVVTANKLDSDHPDPLGRIVELSDAENKRDLVSYRLLKVHNLERHGLGGVQMEFEGTFQGHEFFIVNWILATNGFGYALRTWGPQNLREEVLSEADRVCAGFELISGEAR